MPDAELVIESIAAGGDGVARSAGLVVFVPRSAPGDRARVRWSADDRGAFARGEIMELMEPSEARVEPPCRHYVHDRCGGCQIQHLEYTAQLDAKSRIIGDAIQRIGKRAIQRPTVMASPAAWRYRSKLTLAWRHTGGRWISGLHPYDAPGKVFDLADCPITDEQVMAVWAEVRAAADLLPRARELRCAVRLLDVTDASAEASLVVEGGTSWPVAARMLERCPTLVEIWWEPDRAVARGRARGPGGGSRRLAARRGEAAAIGAAFVQVNRAMSTVMHEHVLELARSRSPSSVIDAYAGIGDTAAALAADGIRVTAIELDADAAAAASSRLQPPSRALHGRAEELVPALMPTDVVILNPPRGGIDAKLAATIESASPRPGSVIYVSCNPATLARDLARMPSWRIETIRGFDMFPQTAHVETVCSLVPESA